MERKPMFYLNVNDRDELEMFDQFCDLLDWWHVSRLKGDVKTEAECRGELIKLVLLKGDVQYVDSLKRDEVIDEKCWESLNDMVVARATFLAELSQ